MISTAVTFFCAVVIIHNPSISTDVLWMFTGISLIVEAVLDLVVLIFRDKERAGKKAPEDEFEKE